MGFSRGPKIVTDGLVLCLDAANKKSYPGSGTTWTDLSGQGNNGTLANMSTTLDSGNGGSLVFDGVNDFVGTSYNLVNGTDSSVPIVISFYINPDSIQSAVSQSPCWIGSAYYSGFGMRYTGTDFQIWLRMTSGIYLSLIHI